MAELRHSYKFILFLSGYSPLFLIFSLLKSNDIGECVNNFYSNREITNPVGIFLIVLDLFSIISIIVTFLMLRIHNTDNLLPIIPKTVKNENSSYLEYLMSYILPLLTINLNSSDNNVFFEILAFITAFGITYLIFTRSNLLHSNIIFLILGYNLFRITTYNQEMLVISKNEDIFLNNEIYLYPINRMNDCFFLEVKGE